MPITYPTPFKDIRGAIVDKVESMDSVENCYGYEKNVFEGIPTVIVLPTDNESAYGSTDKDRLVFIFKLRAYYQMKKDDEAEEAESALEQVVDEMIYTFRERNVLGSVCDWVEPSPSIWEYEERGDAIYRVAEITLRCVKYM